MRTGLIGGVVSVLIAVTALAAQAADRQKVAAFVDVIGYDVMLESLGIGARNAPSLLGLEAADFGATWLKLADDAFEKEELVADAIDILANTMTDELLDHGAAFYASDLGQRLVQAENEAHMADDDMQRREGEALVAEMRRTGSDRPAYFHAMRKAIGAEDSSVQAVIELQVRFLTAADEAGIVALRVKPAELRARLAETAAQLRDNLAESSLVASAWAYRNFSDADVAAYVAALETPQMKLIYQLLSAVQFEMQVTRYEDLARRLAAIFPGQEL